MVGFRSEDSWGAGSWPRVCVPGNGLHTCEGGRARHVPFQEACVLTQPWAGCPGPS